MTVQTGAITAICSIAVLALYLARVSFFFIFEVTQLTVQDLLTDQSILAKQSVSMPIELIVIHITYLNYFSFLLFAIPLCK